MGVCVRMCEKHTQLVVNSGVCHITDLLLVWKGPVHGVMAFGKLGVVPNVFEL